ncbi:hypothetical protein NIA71_10735 [Ihubacter massiliensis]|uniref:LPXTG cell wall anchor domain-containing protein n=1 Tax=Hominibacterium faecale TaxID=2839743 RepID=A0A9J6QSV2_9FIRM|nr:MULTISPECIES: hypothetical protein [Eubacteriales Family XIII. Incertae Sedis]MCI7302108.1 hypothetical protein [Clostridia bacterium]MDE8731988.1 hypothetical protein [Eubacteriales bacterium DFI.9.88]MDY3010432.1 hypothetical protein [Clostridiales Family XIII bacterium]MCO7122418.1 hypothetical protein [Ihubacter massiliensis]MCU7379306.1 hypothetical protein [Hominibacterium faecale]
MPKTGRKEGTYKAAVTASGDRDQQTPKTGDERASMGWEVLLAILSLMIGSAVILGYRRGVGSEHK